MKKLILLFLFLLPVISVFAEKQIVYKVDIKNEIGPEVWRLVKKSFDKAQEANARFIMIHMNTYGGMVVYADSLRSLILNTPKPVWVFIDNNAASAGALIAIACDKIYMREGANIGAATVVNQTGEAMPDKYQSYMRSMIRSTAQAHGKDTVINGEDTIVRWKRDPHIAEAMVDEKININGITDSGKIVTFTTHEALKYGFCDGIAGSLEEVLKQERVDSYTIMNYTPTTSDRIIGFLINPVIQGLLIMLIIGGIYFELQTPGIGFPLMAAMTACLLYFAPLYLEGFANNWEIIAFVIGIILLLLEIFVIPGFGIAGISGIVCIVGALVFAGIDNVSFHFFDDFAMAIAKSLFLVVSSSVMALLLSGWVCWRLFGTPRWAFALHTVQALEDGYVGVDMEIQKEIGKKGSAFTDLHPGGKVMIENEVYDAVSLLGEYIIKGDNVIVKKYQSGQLYVVKIGD